MDHQLTFHPNARAFVEAASPYLEPREDRYGLLLGLARRFAESDESGDEYVFATAGDEGAILRSPRHKVLLSDLPEHWIAPAAAQVFPRVPDAPGVQGDEKRARAFAKAWQSHTDVAVLPGRAQRLYVLRELVAPRPTTGSTRRATADEEDMLQGWVRAFMTDVGSPATDFDPDYAKRLLNNDAVLLWIDDGVPVSCAACSRETPKGASISLVYTPDEYRGKGYATNVTAQLSRELLAGGKQFTTLYTDRANPVTNSIYQQIGYRPVADELELWFDRGSVTSPARL